MGMRDFCYKKLSQATCDKIEWNRRLLRICKSLKEVESTLCGDHKKKKK